jgi:hypothetical protein
MSLLQKLKSWLGRQLTPLERPVVDTQTAGPASLVDQQAAQVVPYDEALLDRARTQWQFGDWESLAAITQEYIQHHPDRAKLALMAAAGQQQLGRAEEAKTLTRQALDWGCSPRLVRQILISGMHNSLARANAILGHEQEAMTHFEAAIDAGTPNADRLVKAARATFQLNQVGVPVRFQIGFDSRTARSV